MDCLFRPYMAANVAKHCLIICCLGSLRRFFIGQNCRFATARAWRVANLPFERHVYLPRRPERGPTIAVDTEEKRRIMPLLSYRQYSRYKLPISII